MTERTRGSWLLYALGALCAGAIVAAVLLVGPSSSSQASVTRTARAAQGVVQSTVSGSGNLQAISQLNLGFKTAGTVTHIYVRQGQHVAQGQLLATLDPQSAEVTLEQAKASLQSAEANLAKEEETDGEGSSAGSASGAAAASVSYTTVPGNAGVAHAAAYAVPGASPDTTSQPASTAPTSTSPTAGAPTSTRPASTPSTRTSTTTTRPTATSTTGTSTESTHESQSNEGSSSPKATTSTATREANLASARAAVRSAKLTAQSDEQSVQDTRLYAPESGTIVSLAGQVGEVVSGSGTTKASSSTSSSSGSGASATGTTGAATARGATGASSAASSSSGSSSSSAFAVLSDLSSMQLVVPLSESEIVHVKAGQIATVTVEALEGRKLAAHVSEVAIESTSSSGAVSYDVTFQLDQMESSLKPGMSATAEVVVKQAEGVNVPTSAISGGEVTVERDGKQVRQRVVTGLAGNSSTIIVSGVKEGETVVLPAASTTSSSATNLISKFAGRAGGGLGGAGGLAGAGGGGGAFFRGGG
jgi:multidrug efflux pump subunit AcrA (membrane-fusion protein)